MDIDKLVRDPAFIRSTRELLPDKRVITKTGCQIIIPCRYTQRKLAYIGADNFIVGIYAMIVDGRYALSTINAMINIDPSSTEKIKIKGDEYYLFTFDPGSTIYKSISLIKDDVLVYAIYDEIISKGYVPHFMGYNDMAKLFDTAKKHAGADIGTDKVVTELIVSMVARDTDNKNSYYRTIAGETRKKPFFIPLRDVTYAATNTTNRIGGSYTEVGIVASMNNPTDRVEKIESILKA